METSTKRKRYNVSLTRDAQTQEDYTLNLSNRFSVLQDLQEEDVNIEDGLKETMITTCEEVLCTTRNRQKERISTQSLRKIQERKDKTVSVNNSRTRAKKARTQEEFSKANKEFKNSINADKRSFMDGLAKEAEEAAASRNMKKLFHTTKYSKPERPVKDKDGNTIMGTEQQLKRWAEHFNDILNRPIPQNPPDILPAEADLPINCGQPTRQEIRKTIRQMKSGKAAEPDGIPAEPMKTDISTSVEMLYPLLGKIRIF